MAAKNSLDSRKYQFVEKPKDLLQILKDGNAQLLGLRPDRSIEKIKTDQKLFIGVEKFSSEGNTGERAIKHQTKTFEDLMYRTYVYNYCFFETAFCKDLARNRIHRLKFGYLIESKKYFLWRDYDHRTLLIYLWFTKSPSRSQRSGKVFGLAQNGVDGI